jgi:hypothetical protein
MLNKSNFRKYLLEVISRLLAVHRDILQATRENENNEKTTTTISIIYIPGWKHYLLSSYLTPRSYADLEIEGNMQQ